MLKITTRNSVYTIKPVTGGFDVTKVAELHFSPCNTVGQTRFSHEAYVREGSRATFDGWSTSTVLKIEEVEDKGNEPKG